jgi:hypothetical protein
MQRLCLAYSKKSKDLSMPGCLMNRDSQVHALHQSLYATIRTLQAGQVAQLQMFS